MDPFHEVNLDSWDAETLQGYASKRIWFQAFRVDPRHVEAAVDTMRTLASVKPSPCFAFTSGLEPSELRRLRWAGLTCFTDESGIQKPRALVQAIEENSLEAGWPGESLDPGRARWIGLHDHEGRLHDRNAAHDLLNRVRASTRIRPGYGAARRDTVPQFVVFAEEASPCVTSELEGHGIQVFNSERAEREGVHSIHHFAAQAAAARPGVLDPLAFPPLEPPSPQDPQPPLIDLSGYPPGVTPMDLAELFQWLRGPSARRDEHLS
jgi:hypothetical protein